MRVHGIPARPIAVGHGVAADALLAPERAALGGDERGLDRLRVEALVDGGDGGVERARGHVLVALVEQLAELDEPGADDGDLVPRHQASPPAAARPQFRLVPVDRHAALVRVAAQHEVDLGADLEAGAVADHLEHDAGAVVEVDDRDRQRRDERRRHRLVDDEGVHDAVPGERHRLELRRRRTRCTWGGSTAAC